MTEVVPADRTKLLQSKRAECSAIIRSRKRKLCILYAVATTPEALPQRSFADPDAKPASAGESQFLEGCDILLGRKLNESSIPTRPRPRSDYPQNPRPSGTYIPNRSAPAATTNKQDVDTKKGPLISPPSIPSQHKSGDGQTNATPSPPISLPTLPLKQPQHLPAWPNQPVNGPVKKDVSPVIDEQQVHGSLPNEKPQAFPQMSKPNGTSPIANGLHSSSPGLSQSVTNQLPTNEQQQFGSRHADAQQRLDQSTPMDIDVAPIMQANEKTTAVQLAPQVDNRRSIDAIPPGSTTPRVATPTIPNVSTNTSPDRDGVPLADSAEAKGMGMKDENALKQSQNGLAPPKPYVTGMSESVPSKSKSPEPTESPNNVVRETSSVADSTQPPKTTLPLANGLSSEKPVTSEVESRPNIAPTNSQQPLQEPSNNVAHGLPMASVQSDERQTDSQLISLLTPNIEVLGKTRNEKETTSKEHIAAPANPPQTTTQNHSQDVQRLPTPTNHQPDRRRTSSPTDVARQKPVSEILSEAPKPSKDHEPDHLALITPTSQPTKHQSQNMLHQARLKGMSKPATVVFGKLPKPLSDGDKSLVQNKPKTGQMPADDYFTPLFVQAFTSNSRWMKPLDQILHQAHKTLSTPDSYTQILDNQACKLLKRVYHLQHHNKWSLRQPKRCPEPTRQASHWDVLLKEMKWMRTDFREERKWKMAAAQNLAYACAEWVASSPEDRKALQVNAVIPPLTSADTRDVLMSDVSHVQSCKDDPTPGLSPSVEFDSPLEQDDEPHDTMLDTVAPSAIFTLESNDVVFALHQSAAADSLLQELPLYGSPLEVPKSDLISPEFDPDASWRRPALPLSKYVEGRMELTSNEPPKKRSRYRYAQEDDEDDEVIFGEHNDRQPIESPNPPVALFWPENKNIRDRLHAGHQFRPPNEHNMPFQSFYENRSPSQWIQSEDDELKSLVREYSYNWSLISNILSSKSMFSSSAERRTPWECFERWVMLEGLPNDMQKTTYFKLWQGRIDASQQVIRNHQDAMQQQAQQQQQQAGPNGPVTPIPKRRFNVPLNVPRRRNQRHLTMIDAMRKQAKKRETAVQKQQHAASLAAMRKPNEAPQVPRGPTKTPREYSIMRFERDQAMAERLAERMAQQQRHEVQRRAALQRAQQGQVQMATAAQNSSQLSQNNPQMAVPHPHAAIARVNTPNQMSINGQGRPRMPMHATPNGASTPNHMSGGLVPPMQMNGTSQVQMPTVNGQSRMAMPTAQPDMQLLMQAQQISDQQRRSVQIRQQQQQQPQLQQPQPQTHQTPQTTMPLQSSPPAMRAAAMNGLNQKSYLNNAQAQAMMASFNHTNGSGMSTPPAQGLTMTSQAGSPRPNSTMPTPTHQTYVSQLQHIESQIRQTHPNTPQDMVRDMARQMLNNRHSNHNLAQSAMNAAAGGAGHAGNANGPHQYAQLLRAQQQQQAAAAAAAQAQQAQQGAQHQRNSSGTPTPTPSLPK